MIVGQGILYVGTGKRYQEEIALSIRSLRAAMPDIPITVFSDESPPNELSDVNWQIIADPTYSFLDKVRYFRETPYQKTLFLDTDTFVLESLDSVFTLLDQFDLAATHEVAREHDLVEPLPDSFPELNTGVLAYRKNPEVWEFFETFLTRYEPLAQKVIGDQTLFRPCLYHSNLRFYVLPSEFNCQIRQAGFLSKRVKILHGRNIDLEEVSERINQYSGKRVHLASPSTGGISILKHSDKKMKLWTILWHLFKKHFKK